MAGRKDRATRSVDPSFRRRFRSSVPPVNVTVAELRYLPLFRSLSEDQLKELLTVFVPRKVARGVELFKAGDAARSFQILTEGEVELVEASEPKIVLRPFSPIGELGALTGLPRNATATATTDAVILEVSSEKLIELFKRSSELAFPFYRSLLDVVSEKVRRDKVRIDEMRGNIIRTQKAMKELRDLVLSNEETALSQPLCDKLDDLIEHNRRSHYRVSPTESHPASARLASGATTAIVEMSEGFLKLSPSAKVDQGDEITVVVTLPKRELPVSGKVERIGGDGVLVKLDLLIDDYAIALNQYMSELRMLDFVV